MKLSDDELDHIDKLLQTHVVSEDEESMILSELDGYLIGIVACPEFIPASEWLPSLFNLIGKVEFSDQKTAETVTEAVMKYHAYITEKLKKSSWINPIYVTFGDSDEIIWGPWLASFVRAIYVRKDVWKNFFLKADDTVTTNFNMLIELLTLFDSEVNFSDKTVQKKYDLAHELIPGHFAIILNAIRGRPSFIEPTSLDSSLIAKLRLGRNDPCFCGSGRKYKKCCGRI